MSKASAAKIIPVLRGNAEALEKAERSELINYCQHYKQMSDEWLRRQIIENNRMDILAQEVLGYQVQPFHLALMAFQFKNRDSLQLVFRGAGKSTICTITKIIHLLIKDPNIRILIASKTTSNSEAFLKEVKGHLEENDRLAELFGPYYDPHLVSKWDNREIEVLPRTKKTKEASVTCVGVEGTIVSKHYDVIISDDLVDEDNSRTKYMRDKVLTWYYQTLDPTLEPPDSSVPHRGEHHRLGTRYHYADLYGHLIKNELSKRHQIIPALDEKERSPWPEKYPPHWFKEKRRRAGTIIFNAQYQCDTEAMKGEVFQYDHCQLIDEKDIPDDIRFFMGIDLAISEKDSAAHFAIAVVAKDKRDNYYAWDFFEGQLRFKAQTAKILKFYRKYDPLRAGIETNAYQEAQYQNLKDEDREIRLTPMKTDKDKTTRAWKLSAVFEDGRFFFRKSPTAPLWIEQFVLFPNYPYKDLFDATDMAVTISNRKRRRKRRGSEPGLI